MKWTLNLLISGQISRSTFDETKSRKGFVKWQKHHPHSSKYFQELKIFQEISHAKNRTSAMPVKRQFLTTRRRGSNTLLSTIFSNKCTVNIGRFGKEVLELQRRFALAGNRTPVSRVAGENSTTGPPTPPYSTFASLKNSTKSVAGNWTFSYFYSSPLPFLPNITLWKNAVRLKCDTKTCHPYGTHGLICRIYICFDLTSKWRFYPL